MNVCVCSMGFAASQGEGKKKEKGWRGHVRAIVSFFTLNASSFFQRCCFVLAQLYGITSQLFGSEGGILWKANEWWNAFSANGWL